MANPRISRKPRRGRTQPPPTEPPLPAWKAFVVQFNRETGADAAVFSGRVGHLSTGQRAYFQSSQELVEFVQAVLQGPQ